MTIDKQQFDRLRRIKFALFIKILFRLIERRDRLVRGEAKYIVSACIKQQQNGNTKYKNMMDAIELNLRGLINDDTWKAARYYAKIYERKHRNRIQRTAKGEYGLDEIGDQDLIEIEILRPYEHSSSSLQESQHKDSQLLREPPEAIGSSAVPPILPHSTQHRLSTVVPYQHSM